MGIFTDIYNKLFGSSEPVEAEVVFEKPKPVRKAPDRRQITTVAYDYICEAHTEWEKYVKAFPYKDRPPIHDLVDFLNTELCLDKSYRYYQRIWSGKNARTNFPDPEYQIDLPKQHEFDFGEH